MRTVNLENVEAFYQIGDFTGLGLIDSIIIGPKVSSEEEVALLKAEGVQHVIDMKRDGETPFSDKEEFEKQGITYRHFPVANPIDIDFDELKSLEKDIKETDGKLYIYCMSGNRVSGILARFFVEVCGHPKERVLDAITKLQMIRPDLLEATKIKLS